MAILEVLSFKLAAPAIKLLAKWVLPEPFNSETVVDELGDLVDARLSQFEERRKAKRLFEDLQDEVAKRLEHALEREFSGLPESDRMAATETVASVLETKGIASETLRSNLDPDKLYQGLRQQHANEFDSLGGDATLAADMLLRETCVYVVRLVDKLPDFRLAQAREMLVRQAGLTQDLHKVLDAVVALREESVGTRARESQNFETNYRRALVRSLDQMHLFGVRQLNEVSSEYPLSIAYVTLRANTSGENDGGTVESILPEKMRLLVRGEAGTGKTTLMQWIAVRAARRDFSGNLSSWNHRIPIYLRLRDFAKENVDIPTPENFLRGGFASTIAHTMPTLWMHDVLEHRALVLIDGVDELPISKRSKLIHWLISLVDTFPDAVFVVSSRPAALDADSPHHSVGAALKRHAFEALTLEPLRLRESEMLVTQWHQAVAQDVLQEGRLADLDAHRLSLHRALRERPAIRNLASNPLLCAMLCALNWHLNQRLPNDRMTLYQTALEMLISRRDSDRDIQATRLKEINFQGKQDLLDRLAYWMLRNGITEASEDEIRTQLALSLPRHLSSIQGDATLVLQELLERSGVLRRPQHGLVDFIHRTFLEYMGARAAVQSGDVGLLVERAKEESWRETIVFAVGHSQGVARDKLIQRLLEKPFLGLGRRSAEADVTAVCCLETGSSNLSPELLSRLLQRSKTLFPPISLMQAPLLAPAASLYPDLIEGHQNASAMAVAGCIRCAAMIGGERMLSVIESYARIDAPLVRGELFDAWTGFDMGAYRDRVVMKMPWWGELLKASSPGRKDLPPIDELVRLVELLCYRGEHLGKAKTFEEAISRFMKWRWLYLGSLEDELGSSAPTGSKVPDQEPRTSVEVDEERRRPKDKAKLITLADLKRVVAIESLDDVRLAVPVEAAALPLLAKLQGLTEFGLILNDATLLSSVARFNRLERLHLKGDSYSGRSASPTIYDLGPLKELPDLKSLSIEFFWEDARIEMPSLDELPKLTKIEVVYSCVGRVLGQVRSRYLEELNLHVGSVGDLLDLSACSALHTLTISVEEPTTLKLPGTIVSLRIMQGANVTLEGDFSSLERLYIGGKKTHLKMEPLFEAPALKKVVVDDSPNALKPEVRQMLVDRGVEFEAR